MAVETLKRMTSQRKSLKSEHPFVKDTEIIRNRYRALIGNQ